jgi:hypothetical protein
VVTAGTSTLTAACAAVLIRLAALATLGWSRLDPTAGLVLAARPSSKGSTPGLAKTGAETSRRAFADRLASAGVVAGLVQARSSFSVGVDVTRGWQTPTFNWELTELGRLAIPRDERSMVSTASTIGATGLRMTSLPGQMRSILASGRASSAASNSRVEHHRFRIIDGSSH